MYLLIFKLGFEGYRTYVLTFRKEKPSGIGIENGAAGTNAAAAGNMCQLSSVGIHIVSHFFTLIVTVITREKSILRSKGVRGQMEAT